MKLSEIKSKDKSVADMHIDYQGGDFYCAYNELTSLEGVPSSISGDFNCNYNELTSLEGAPSSISGDFYCSNNELTSLEGAPSSISGDFYCRNNKLTSLANIHRQIREIRGGFYVQNNPIKSHVLGLLLIKGITEVMLDNAQVTNILNRHLPSRGMRDVLEAQDELIEAGLEEFAQL